MQSKNRYTHRSYHHSRLVVVIQRCTFADPTTLARAQAAKNEFDAKLFRAEAIHGSHLSLHMRMERALLARHQRLPLLTSEFAGLDTVLNRDDTIDFSDFLAGTNKR